MGRGWTAQILVVPLVSHGGGPCDPDQAKDHCPELGAEFIWWDRGLLIAFPKIRIHRQLSSSADPNGWLQWPFFAAVGLFVLYQMYRGWQRGVMRQLFHLLALVLAYASAWFGGPQVAPALRPLGFPDMVLSAVGGAGIAFVVYLFMTVIGVILFKKTSQQDVGIIRFCYGVSGAALGFVFSLVFVWGAVLGVRVLGTIAESQMAASRVVAHKHRNQADATTASAPPNPLVRGLAEMKYSLEHGMAEPVVTQLDPIPPKVYKIIGKITTLISNPDSAARFLDYPGAQQLASNPKIVELRDDPDIAREIKAKDLVALLKNKHIVSVANDPEMAALLRKFELEKALDYSLNTTQKNEVEFKRRDVESGQ